MNIIAFRQVVRVIKENILNNSIWPDFTAIPNFENVVVKFIELKPKQPIQASDDKVTPYRVHHSVPETGFLIENNKGKRSFYTDDTGPTSFTWKKLKGRRIDCLVIEVSFLEKMEELALKTRALNSRAFEEGGCQDETPSREDLYDPPETPIF